MHMLFKKTDLPVHLQDSDVLYCLESNASKKAIHASKLGKVMHLSNYVVARCSWCDMNLFPTVSLGFSWNFCLLIVHFSLV